MSYGISISQAVRSQIVANTELPFNEAQAIADAVEVRMEAQGCTWVETSKGTTFEKTFVPK